MGMSNETQEGTVTQLGKLELAAYMGPEYLLLGIE